jgi:hypothetical protein
MNNAEKTSAVLVVLAVVLALLALKFATGFGAPAPALAPIPLVDTNFLDTATFRKSYAELIRTKADLSDFDCYACHSKGKPPTLRFDAQQNLIVPKEHEDIVMHHGSHGRNNNCFNCHNEQNLELLQTRDGHEVKLAESPRLCGSCHGPTYRDWEAGAHGRTGGYWDRSAGPMKRQICVDCHDPHHPKIPPRQPAPGPHLLHPPANSEARNAMHTDAGSLGAGTWGQENKNNDLSRLPSLFALRASFRPHSPASGSGVSYLYSSVSICRGSALPWPRVMAFTRHTRAC